MGEAGAVVIAFVVDEDLGFVLQASKGSRMDDAVPVTLKRQAKRMVRLRMDAAAAVAGVHRVGGQGRSLHRFELPPIHRPGLYSRRRRARKSCTFEQEATE